MVFATSFAKEVIVIETFLTDSFTLNFFGVFMLYGLSAMVADSEMGRLSED